MARPKGTKMIESPEKMWSLFEDYKKKTKANPIQKNIYGGKDFEKRLDTIEKPLTMVGFENYVFTQGLNADLADYFSNRDERYDDYVSICSRIRGFIRQDQIEGGMAGIYNSSITQRLNGLVDKKQTEVKGEPRVFNIDPDK